jgi:hypothetical protein
MRNEVICERELVGVTEVAGEKLAQHHPFHQKSHMN